VHGREVLGFIKGDAALAAIPTVILTSSSSTRDRRECLALGADAYFTKASTLAELNDLARRIDALIVRGPGRNHFQSIPGIGAVIVGLVRALLARLMGARAGIAQ
jgi:CheY-like chemotaxis protein